MAVSNLPVFAQAPKSATVVTTAVLGAISSGTPTNAATLMTAGPNGALITKLVSIPMGSAVAGSVDLFESASATALTTMYLVDSELLPSYTQSATTAIPELNFGNISQSNPKRIGPGMSLSIGCEVAQSNGLAHHVEWQDL